MADISTAVSMARVPILGENGRISDDYIPAAIGENATKAESAAKRAETAATNAEGSATAARQNATGAQGSASAAGESANKAQESATAASGAVTQAQSAQQAAEAAKTGAESARGSAQTAASQAQQSATAAAESAANVADKFISSAKATTLEPGSQATASVADQVLTLGIPRGDKGDKGDTGEKGDPGDVSVVQTAEGSDLSVSTDEGTVTIDDSALRARISELENQAANVVTGVSTGLVAHGEDAYAQKPREVRIKGKTWVNRWPVIEGTDNGITVTTDETGLITVTGTSTGESYKFSIVNGIRAGASITCKLSISAPTDDTWSPYIEIVDNEGTYIGAGNLNGSTTIPSNAGAIRCGIHVYTGQTVNASFRVMLVDGTEAPDCFTPPASIASVKPENLVTSGKNLLPSTEITKLSNSNAYAAYDGMLLHPGSYTITCDSVDKPSGIYIRRAYDNSTITSNENDPQTPTFSFTLTHTEKVRFEWYFLTGDAMANGVSNPMLELGSTATAYEPPNVTTTPLPEVELRSLPNGTCDELVIRADGTCEVERLLKRFDSDSSGWYGYAVSGELALICMRTSSGLSDAGWYDVISELPVAKTLVAQDTLLAPHWAYNGTAVFFRFPATEASDLNSAIEYMASIGAYCYAQVPMTTEPQSPVTLPALPAPTFNQYHDGDVSSDTSTEYVRDINIVIDNLAKQVAGAASAVAVREASTIEEE